MRVYFFLIFLEFFTRSNRSLNNKALSLVWFLKYQTEVLNFFIVSKSVDKKKHIFFGPMSMKFA